MTNFEFNSGDRQGQKELTALIDPDTGEPAIANIGGQEFRLCADTYPGGGGSINHVLVLDPINSRMKPTRLGFQKWCALQDPALVRAAIAHGQKVKQLKAPAPVED